MKLRSLGIWGLGRRAPEATRSPVCTNHVRTRLAALLSFGVVTSLIGACAPVPRDFGSGGQGGSGGMSQVCEANTSEPCYSGPAGTEDVGVCKKGTHTCLPDGTGYGACDGEVVPTAEICTTPIDEGCDGPNPVECPSLNHVWSKSFGGVGEDLVTAMAVDPTTGDVIATGYFHDTIDFGGGPMASTGNEDIFLVRLTADGNHVWSKRFGDAESQNGRGIALDASGAIYVVGGMYGSVDFGDGKPVMSKGSSDVFLAKFDSNGNVIWSRVFGDSSSQEGKSVAVTPTNQVVIAGDFSGFIQLTGMELPSNASTDMFVIKLDSSGFDVGAKKYGGPNLDQSYDMTVDSAGAVILAGSFSGSADFGTLGSFPSAGDDDAFVLKLNPDLSESWVRTFGDAMFQRAGTVVTSPKNDVFVMGDFTGTITLGDGSMLTAPPTLRSVYLLSLNTDGAHRWAKSTGNAQSFFARQMMTVDPFSQSIVAVGFYDGILDFGGGPLDATATAIDSFVTKIGWDGTHISSKRFGGPAIDAFFDVGVSATGDVFVGGGHQGPADFGGGTLMAPAPDDFQALLMRLLP